MNTYDLNDRVAVITGGAQGIGFATAQRMAASGARVALWDLDGDLATDAADGLGDNALALSVDVTDADAVSSVAEATVKALGGIDILVCGAGIAGPNAPIPDYPPGDWQAIMDINVTGVFNLNEDLISSMKDKIVGKKLILIDDLCTTGATLISAAKMLLKLKPKSISAAVISRVI